MQSCIKHGVITSNITQNLFLMGFPKPLSHVLINELSAALPQQKEATRQPLRDKHIAKKKKLNYTNSPETVCWVEWWNLNPERSGIHRGRRVGHPDWLYKKSIQGRASAHTLIQTLEACVCLSCNLSFRSLKNDVTERQPQTERESQPASQTRWNVACLHVCVHSLYLFTSLVSPFPF